MLQSGGRYFFLPAGWTTADGAALVLPRTDSLRLEVTAAGPAPRTGAVGRVSELAVAASARAASEFGDRPDSP